MDRPAGPPVDMDLLRDALDFVRPALQSDGGDLTLLACARTASWRSR